MHRALLLPEIVATILRAEAVSPGFLHTCLFINRLFSVETTRMLWKGCGVRYNSATAGHVAPDITHLAHIVQMDHQRAQFYANFIHTLQFDEEGEDNNFIEEARWHKELAVLQFPNLQEIGFFGFAEAMQMNTGDVVLHYAQPNVTYFNLDEASWISDSFLDTLSQRCPKLQTFTLGEISDSSLTEDGIVRFIKNCDSLDYLSVRTGLLGSWTRKEFEASARHPKLELLSIPDIPDDWLDFLRHERSISPAFPKLAHFYTGISDQALELLFPYMPNLQSLNLNLENLSPSHHILTAASNFTRLTSLNIDFGPKCTLSGHDLVLLAQKCPELKELHICEWEGSHPAGVGVTDSIIDEAAQHMGNMSQLVLAFDRSDLLTWQSVLSIARHCKKLMQLRIPCNFTWKEAMDNAPVNTFPRLWRLAFTLDQNNRGGPLAEAGKEEETLNAYASQVAGFAPQLSNFQVEGGNAADEALEKAINTICNPRYVPRPLGSTE